MRDPARILVVDDVADNVEILRMRLESLGYEIVAAEDGEQALAKVAETLPDLRRVALPSHPPALQEPRAASFDHLVGGE